MKTKPFYLFFVLCLLASCMQEDFSSEQLDEGKEEAFFHYTGNEYAIRDILTALKGKNDSAHFVSRYLEEYGQPLWDKAKILPTEGETMVAFPVKKSGNSQIETIWFFIASGNKMTYFPFTTRVLPELDEGADVGWMFDYFTQQVYPKRNYSTRYEKYAENSIVTKGGIWIEYCVHYSITTEFQGSSTTKRGIHCWTEYYYLADNIPTIGHVEPPIAGGQGDTWINNQGNWAGGTPPDNRPVSEQEKEKNLNAIYDPKSGLTDGQKEDLKNTLGELAENPILRGVLDYIKDKGLKIKFGINPALTAATPAKFTSGSNSISFRTPDNINNGSYLEEELIHAAQYLLYGNLFNSDFINFEFEAKVFRDIAHTKTGGAYIGCMGQSKSFSENYKDWINSIGYFPPYTFGSEQVIQFFIFLQLWTGYHGAIDPSLNPLLLINYIH